MSNILPSTISAEAFAERQSLFHRAVYASEPFVFDDVMARFWEPPAGCVAHDHGIIHADGKWHLFVLSNELELHAELVNAVRAGNWDAAERSPYSVGDRHLVGKRLTELADVGFVLSDPYGEWGTLAHTNSCVFPYKGRWGNIHCAMSRRGQRLCVEWSDDLQSWQADSHNPLWAPPEWAGGTTVCKGPCVVEHGGRWFVFYNLNLSEGTSTVSLISTSDFKHFEDHGPVMKFANQYRGTQGCESPCVFVRDGIWHLMVSSGDSWWHGISDRPNGFLGAQGIQSATAGGVYDMGPFHVGKVVEKNGQWWMTSSYKAEHRWRCRRAGRVTFRGENDDESGLCQGLFISRIEWDGDRPVLVKPRHGEIP